jgi:splicing factor 3A subunit 1
LYASIDWHDFVVVQTLEFNDEDKNVEFPMPTTLKELESMTLAQKKSSIINELVAKDEDQVVDMDVDVSICSHINK